MKRNTIISAIGVLISFATLMIAPAMSAPVSSAMPTASPEYDWSGFYLGANAGWADSSTSWRYTNPVPVGCCVAISPSADGSIVGMHAGVQVDWNHVVLGVEGGVNAFTGGRWASGACFVGAPIICQIQPQAIETLGGRLGWGWTNWLFYGDGGAARTGIDTQLVFPVTGSTDFTESTYNGWYAGGGIEYMLVKGPLIDVIVGAEYQHIDFGTKTQLSVLDGFGPCPPGSNCRNVGAKEDIARIRLSLKVNPFAPK